MTLYTWVLIVMMSNGVRGGVAVSTQEFTGEKACWEAQKIVMQWGTRHSGIVSATCVPKSRGRGD